MPIMFSLHCGNIHISHVALVRFLRTLTMVMKELFKNPLDTISLSWRSIAGSVLYTHSGVAMESLSTTESVYCNQDFLSLLVRCRKLKATDERDSIYGLMHLVDEYSCYRGLERIEIDYEKPVKDVLMGAISNHVAENQTLLFLCHHYLSSSSKISTRLKERTGSSWFPYGYFAHKYALTSLSRNTLPETKCPPDCLSADGKRLTVRGVKVDKVRRCLSSGDKYMGAIKTFCRSSLVAGILACIQTSNDPETSEQSKDWYEILSCASGEEPPRYGDIETCLLTLKKTIQR